MKRRSFLVASSLSVLAVPALAQEEECGAGPEEAGGGLINVEKMAKFSPKARTDLLEAIVSGWKRVIDKEVITTRRVHHFLAQIATETGGFLRLDENLNYSASRLRKVFKSRVTDDQAASIEHKPQLIANQVYGGEWGKKNLGNIEKNDGWTYRGSGFMQLTGRSNFERRGKALDMDLVHNPDWVREPTRGFEVAVSYWGAVKANEPADDDNLTEVRRRINGGRNGLEEAGIWLARARRIFTNVPTQPGEADSVDEPELQAIQATLEKLDLLQQGPEESSDLSGLISALMKFRTNQGLPEIAIANFPPLVQVKRLYDEDLLYALTDYQDRLLEQT